MALTDQQINITRSLLTKGMTLKEISSVLGCKKDAVKYVANKQMQDIYNSKKYLNQYGDIKKREKIFEGKFNKAYEGLFEYYKGFKDIDSSFISKCLICGAEQERHAQCLRKARPIKCNHCIEVNADKRVRQQKIDAEVRKREKQEAKALKENQPKPIYTSTCKQCGVDFESTRKNPNFCSITCRNKFNNKKKELNRNLKLKENGKIDWSITLDKLYARDNGECYICGSKCNLNDFEYADGLDTSTFIAGDTYPSIDHVKAVKNGGTHTWDNIKLAHRLCNSIKRDRYTHKLENGEIYISL